MSLLRLRCSCKKIIINNQINYTFVISDYNASDMKKILERELNMINNLENINEITKIKSFANSQEYNKDDLLKKENFTKQIISIRTKLNDLKIRSNIKIAKLVDNINKSVSSELIIYIKVNLEIGFDNIPISFLEVYGVEVPKEEPKKQDKIINMIKLSKKQSDDIFIS